MKLSDETVANGRSPAAAGGDSPSLISLAILKVNWDRERKDYLENFVPLVAESLRALSSDAVSLIDLQATVRGNFGLDLSQSSLKTILGRVKKRGYVRLSNGAYFRDPNALAKLNFRDVQRQVLKQHEALVADLRRFASDKYSLGWTVEDAEDALQSYLAGSERKILTATTFRTMIPEPATKPRSTVFIVAKFVQFCQESHSPSLDYLETIVKGSMLANAIFLHNPASSDHRFRNTVVYFDTSFIIFALGYAGEPRKAPCHELLNLLNETGAELACFSHTVEEVRGVLNACASKIGRGEIQSAYGPSIEFFLATGKRESDILVYANRLERDIRALRMKIIDKPPFIHSLMIDEKGFGEALASRIDYHERRGPLDRDVASISAIMRLRGSGYYFMIEECRALFVTTNAMLAQTTWDFLMKDATPGAVSPCITDHGLTNLLWLKKPLQAPDLPRKRLIADCYAAAQPSDHLWHSYLEEIDRLEANGSVTSDNVFLLRHTLEAKTALMDKTLGEEEAFVQGTVPEILETVRAGIERSLRTELSAESQRAARAEEALEAERRRSADRSVEIQLRSRQIAARIVSGLESWLSRDSY